MAWTLLRPTGFMQNTLAWGTRVLDGTFYSPVPDAAFSIVDARDVAEVAAVALTEDGHEGKAYGLSGPEAVSYRDQAKRVFAAAGREIEVEEIPVETLKRELVRAGVPPWNAEGLEELFEVYAERRRADGHLRRQGRRWTATRATSTPSPPTTWSRSRRSSERAGARDSRPSPATDPRGLLSGPAAGRRATGASRWTFERRSPTTLRGTRQAPVLTVIEDLQQPPQRHRRRLPAPAPAQPPAGQAARASTSTASSARCRTSPGRASARSTPPTSRSVQLEAAPAARAAAGLQPRQVPAHDRLRDAQRRARGRRRPRPPRRRTWPTARRSCTRAS